MKKIKEWFINLPSFFFGPSYFIHTKLVKEKDTNHFTMAISFVAMVVICLFVRGANKLFNDLGIAFRNMFISVPNVIISSIIIAISIAGLIIGWRINKKKNFISLTEGISFLVFELFIYLTISCSISYGITRGNWLLWFIMMIPTVIFLYSTLVKGLRFFIKLVFGRDIPGRAEDYLYRTRNYRKLWIKFGRYLKKNWGQILLIIALLVLAVMVLTPLVIMLMRSFKGKVEDITSPLTVPVKIQFENYSFAWENLKNAFLNSLITTFGVTIGTLILSSLLAYAFVRFNFPLKNILYFLILGLMMIPGILTLISRYRLVYDLGLIGNLWGIILPGMAGFVPASFILLFTFFRGIPHDFFDASEIDGANSFSVYFRIVLPLSRPIMWTVAIQTFVGEWNDYLWANLVENGKEELYTLPVILKTLSNSYFSQDLGMGVPFAGYVLSAIPLVLIFIVASKQFIEGLTSGAFKM